MKPIKFTLLTFLCASSLLLLMGAQKKEKSTDAQRVARGKYLVNFGGCNDCHTPLKMTDKGPVPDMTRMLSGHPESTKLPAPDLKPGPWFASTAGMTAWAGPWGISFAANLTPDVNTGMGIWTEEMFVKAMKTGKHMGAGRVYCHQCHGKALLVSRTKTSKRYMPICGLCRQSRITFQCRKVQMANPMQSKPT